MGDRDLIKPLLERKVGTGKGGGDMCCCYRRLLMQKALEISDGGASQCHTMLQQGTLVATPHTQQQ
jgi:hypothetical protein